MAKLAYTELGELIVFRLCWANGHKSRHVFPTHRKAMNYLLRCRFTHAMIEPVQVFPGKMDSERIAQARKVLADPYAGDWSIAQALKLLRYLGADDTIPALNWTTAGAHQGMN